MPSSGKKICVRMHRLYPDAPGVRDALDIPWNGTYRSQREMHRQCEFGHSTPWYHAFGRRMLGCHTSGRSSPWHLLTGRSVSGYFPSGRSRVRAFSFWMQPCQSIFLLAAAVSGQMASGQRVSWHHGHAVCQGTEHCSKYSCCIRKHAVGSRYSDSTQFYSFYLIYIYICYYQTLRGNKGKLANTTRCIEQEAMSTT